MNQSDKIDQLIPAVIKTQGAIRGATKDSTNPFFKSKYADLESCWEAVKPALQANGLAIIQLMSSGSSGPELVTMLAHSSGQWICGSQPVCAKSDNDPQALGSAISYARRYGLAAIIGLIQVDDDANQASRVSGIYPEQPPLSDGRVIDKGYFIPFGKWKARTIEQVMRDEGPDAIYSYINYLEEMAQKENKPIRSEVADFIQRAAEFIGSWENETK